MPEGYNGWTNYETWAVNVWMTNDEGSSTYWDEQAQEAYDRASADTHRTRDEVATQALADQIEQETGDGTEDMGLYGLYSDLLSAALGAVDWYEIAEHYIAEVEKQEEIAEAVTA